jgi:hypothetical protein
LDDTFDFSALRAFSISKSGRDDVRIEKDDVGRHFFITYKNMRMYPLL